MLFSIKKPFDLFAIAAYISDIVTIFSFIFQGTYKDYFSPLWFFDVSLILLFIILGFYLSGKSEIGDKNKYIMVFFAILYGLFSAIIYIMIGFSNVFLDLGEKHMWGMAILFLISFVVALYCIFSIGKEYIKYYSYFFGVSLFIFLSFLIYHHPVQGNAPDIEKTIFNFIIGSIGGLLFIVLDNYGTERQKLSRKEKKRLW